ncbi:MAG: DUF1080 domain-containing protein [Lentisphaeraceae bacterium]|nr:DUF1080 domain-containing protein [Lentisphaeraceae bacterium]
MNLKNLKQLLIFLSLITAVNAQGKSGEWQSLFDGKTLTGWSSQVKGELKVVDGEMHLLSKKKNLWLISDQAFEDFELEVEVEALMPKGVYNSGIGFRISLNGKKKPFGYQCEIDGQKSGSVYAIGKGWVFPQKNQWDAFYKKTGNFYKKDTWNKFRIVCQGQHMQIWVNGQLTIDLQDSQYKKGRIALQHHGKGDVYKFRNIRLRLLNTPVK